MLVWLSSDTQPSHAECAQIFVSISLPWHRNGRCVCVCCALVAVWLFCLNVTRAGSVSNDKRSKLAGLGMRVCAEARRMAENIA